MYLIRMIKAWYYYLKAEGIVNEGGYSSGPHLIEAYNKAYPYYLKAKDLKRANNMVQFIRKQMN